MDLKEKKTKEIIQWLEQLPKQEMIAVLPELLQDERRSVQSLAQRYQKKLDRIQAEQQRIAAMWQYEQAAKACGFQWIAGTDEVGRGPLAGPVVAAAVILPEGAELPGIKDSKKLTEAQRETLNVQIRQQAVAFAIVEVDEKTIDRINILEASRLAMQKAISQLTQPADFVLVDGLPNPQIMLPAQAIVKGDNKSISIAAASILAKVYRDHLMEALDVQYPGYGFAVHKGYPTEAHLQAIAQLGPSPIHRMSFGPLRNR